jgi:hypothetical protein
LPGSGSTRQGSPVTAADSALSRKPRIVGADIGAIGLHARQRDIATTRAYVQQSAALNNPAAKVVGL